MDPACNSKTHVSRRTLLRTAGLSGLAWLTPVAHWLGRAQEQAPMGGSAKSIIMLWMGGGPSQLETFDPHPGKKIAGGTKAIGTAAKGIQIAAGLPQTAEVMDEMTLVRSVVSREGDHERGTYHVKTGHRPDPTLVHPAIGAVVCHQLNGPEDQQVDIPRHISILPNQWPARGGYLGAQWDAFKVYNTEGRAGNLTARVKPERLDRRLDDLQVVEQKFTRRRRPQLDEKTTLHNHTIYKALRMMRSDQINAFDVTQAPAATRDGFGKTPFGNACLAAVQLIETGVRCVEVTLNGWDTHANNHAFVAEQNAILDPALAGLIRELRARDRLKDTLVVCAGEFGRTPKINAADGRDHWPTGFSIALAGGGIRRGYVHGETDPEGVSKEPGKAVSVADVHATLLHDLGIDTFKELMTPVGRPMGLTDGIMVPELLTPA